MDYEALKTHAQKNEELGRLSPDTVKLLNDSGVMRLLLPKPYGGEEAHPRDWAEQVMKIAARDGAAGWVAGVVGVHPWESAFLPDSLLSRMWSDPTVWVGSPYAPMGKLQKQGSSYTFEGRWQFSTGSDHCEWFVLGGLLFEPNGELASPMRFAHVWVPKSGVEIVPDSWNVVGLQGTGSNDIIVKPVRVSPEQVLFQEDLESGDCWRKKDLTSTLYRLPFTTMFPLGITSALIGICEGGLEEFKECQKSRRLVTGAKAKNDPYLMPALAEAEAELKASKMVVLQNIDEVFRKIDGRGTVSLAERAEYRRDQVRAAWRAVQALDSVVVRAGANGLRRESSLQRYWRDAHMGLGHAIHVPGPLYNAAALASLDETPPPGMGYLI